MIKCYTSDEDDAKLNQGFQDEQKSEKKQNTQRTPIKDYIYNQDKQLIYIERERHTRGIREYKIE